ncbi:transposase [Streptomonospora litoralis]|nr:transposase [Streptomonospora litoralis]
MRSVCADFEVELVEFNGESDHLHPLVGFTSAVNGGALPTTRWPPGVRPLATWFRPLHCPDALEC